MTEKTLYIVRHGQTEWNSRQMMIGHKDVDLNDIGLKQAQSVASALRTLHFDLILSSDLLRARNTTRIIANQFSTKIQYLSMLREHCFGEYEGRTIKEYFEAIEMSGLSAWEYRTPGGESVVDASLRANEMVKFLQNCNGSTILIVGHESFNRTLVMSLLGLSFEERSKIKMDNCSITEIKLTEGGAELIRLNDCLHIENERIIA